MIAKIDRSLNFCAVQCIRNISDRSMSYLGKIFSAAGFIVGTLEEFLISPGEGVAFDPTWLEHQGKPAVQRGHSYQIAHLTPKFTKNFPNLR